MVSRTALISTLGLAFLLAGAGASFSRPSQQACCRGQQRGMGKGGGMMDAERSADMAVFHFLLDNRDAIRRDVEELENGIKSVTESDDAEIAAKIKEHVAAMYRRVEERRPIHARDPLFAEVFRHADAIDMEIVETDKGVVVTETSADPYVAKLIKAHAEVANNFITNGHLEMRKDHELPAREPSK